MVVVRTPKLRAFLLLLVSAGFVATSVWIFVNGMWIVGATGTLFFGLAGGVIFRKLLLDPFALVIDRVGIIDNASGISAGRIRWEEIVDVRVESMSGESFIGIDVSDREALYARRPAGAVQRANTALGFCPVTIPAMALDRPVDDVATEIEEYWRVPETRAKLGEYGAVGGSRRTL